MISGALTDRKLAIAMLIALLTPLFVFGTLCIGVSAADEELEEEEEVRVQILDPENEEDLREILKHYPDGVPEGFRVRRTVNYYFTMKGGGRHIERTHEVVPVNEDGQRHGIARRGSRRIEYKNDVRHGMETEYRSVAREPYVFRKIPWVEGEIHGTMEIFYPDGSIRTRAEYHEGKRVGEARTYTQEGDLTEVVPYKDGAMHGDRVLFFPGTDVVRRKIPYEQGSVNGAVKEFHPDGSLRRILPHRNNQRHGIQEEYDEEGNLTLRRYWLDGDMVAKGKFDREYEE